MIKKETGITLIALVITIVVLLILAGVTIATLTGNNGIITRANEAKTQTEMGEEKEAIELAYNGAMAENNGSGVSYQDLNDQFELNGRTDVNASGENPIIVTFDSGRIYEIDENGNIKDSTTGGGEETENIKEYTEDGVPVPKGFYYVGGTKEDGVIISDSSQDENKGSTHDATTKMQGNQFVWVPVSDINEMAQCSNAGGTCNLDLVNNEIVCTTHSNNTQIVGKLNATSTGNNFDSSTPNTTYNPNSGLREPAIVTGNSSGTGTKYDGDIINNSSIINTILETNYTTANELLTDMQIDYAKMIKSIDKYGGFYISRYEMSKDSSNRVASISGVTPLINDSDNMWYGLYAYGKTYNTSSVESSMVWGSQYDAMMRWMYDNGNGTDVKGNIGDDRNTGTTTGTVGTDVINNIYDLYGCHYEWTLEAGNTDGRVYRGRCLQLQLFT